KYEVVCLLIGVKRRGDARICCGTTLLKVVELGIVIDGPPSAAIGSIWRRGLRPVSIVPSVTVSRWRWYDRQGIVRSNSASAQPQGTEKSYCAVQIQILHLLASAICLGLLP